jgi:hypothetical protein
MEKKNPTEIKKLNFSGIFISVGGLFILGSDS